MPSVNQQVGPYTLIKKLGQGGFGEVWLAEKQTKFVTKKLAVKLPLKDQVDTDAVRHEATLWEQASGHPNVLPIIDADEYDGQIVIVSEYAPDGSLADLLKKQGRLSVEKAVEMIDGVLAGLEFLHSRKIIHRDLKPDNVLVQGETPRLADFGISRVLRTTMTSSSVNLAGTPYYMAPECFDKKRNEQTDIWAVGVILYEILAGNRPFEDDNLINLVSSIATKEPENLPANVPTWLNDVTQKALAKSPENRYKTVAEMRSHLKQLAKMPDTQQVVVLPTPKDEDKTLTDYNLHIPTPPPIRKENNSWKIGAVVLSTILLGGIGGAIYLNQPSGEKTENINVASNSRDFANSNISPNEMPSIISNSNEHIETNTSNSPLNQTWTLTKQFKGHTDSVLTVAIAPNGNLIASGGNDNYIRLWDINTGKEIKTIKGHSSSVSAVNFSPDGKILASGSWDKTIRLWEVQTGNEIRIISNDKIIDAVTFSPNGKTLATGNDGSVKLWDVDTGRNIRIFPEEYLSGENRVFSVTFSPDGKLLAKGCDHDEVKVWDVETGKEIYTLEGYAVTFSHNGKMLATGIRDIVRDNKPIKIWSIDTGKEIRTLTKTTKNLKSIRFSPDDKYLYSCGDRTDIRVWDVSIGIELPSISSQSGCSELDFSEDGRKLVTDGSKVVNLRELR